MKTQYDSYDYFVKDLQTACFEDIVDYLVGCYELSQKLSIRPYGTVNSGGYISPEDEIAIDDAVYYFRKDLENCLDIQSMFEAAIDYIDTQYCQDVGYWIEYLR